MATIQEQQEQTSLRDSSPSPTLSPTHAIGSYPGLSRSLSATSDTASNSTGFSSQGRESLGSSVSRSSSATYSSRSSLGGAEARTKRRGYVRPQGTNFSSSAQARESVMSLGSIAHLQYYFARTGLLDGKGGRLAKKKENGETLDLSALDTSLLSPTISGFDADLSYASMGSSPDGFMDMMDGMIGDSPIEEYDYYSGDDYDDSHMLPPTVSTYMHREKVIPRPLTLMELRSQLRKALADGTRCLDDAKSNPTPPTSPPQAQTMASAARSRSNTVRSIRNGPGWFGVQGMHILDIMTLAIRAAKMYCTAHDQPARLSSIKTEREIRADLLTCLDVLKRMATRDFQGGMRNDERETMESWIEGVHTMLKQEEKMEETEKQQRRSWTWLEDEKWEGEDIAREYAFIKSMDPNPSTLPEWTPMTESTCPSEFLKELSTGLRLVTLHNAAVQKSKRRFGTIDKWHTDFGKPYRPAENLRYWIKAAELRWEVFLTVDVMGVVNGSSKEAWEGFEQAVWKWCAKVREEITAEMKN